MIYNWQQPDWSTFGFDTREVEEQLFSIAEETGHITGMVKSLPENMQVETIVDIMVLEAIKSSVIEGEYLSRPDVVSSIKNNLGLNKPKEAVKDRKARGAGELMVAVRRTYGQPLSNKTLFSWHKMLLVTDTSIRIGMWRTHAEPMQIVSGASGKEKVHFEAPPSKQIPAEMDRFIKWFNDTAPGGKHEIKKAPVRAAIAHLYFESIHPFEDGNGRIGRAIAEKALSQTIGRPVMMSLSQTIEANKKAYYQALKKAQRSNEITAWLKYFINVVLTAQMKARELIDFTLKKTKFLDRYKDQLNQRQLKSVIRMFDFPEGFEGGMTAKKYTSLTKASKATATRDLQILAELKILVAEGGGRSTHYYLNI